MIAIVANGGAGGIPFARRRKKGLVQAVEVGYEILKQGGSALDAVEEATVVLEDTPIFNAGTGSALTIDGRIEMDASLMTSDLKCGAVAAIRDVKNPIRIARLVMEQTDHVILGGASAVRFARKFGFAKFNLWTKEKRRLLKQAIKKMKQGLPNKYFPRHIQLLRIYELDTVGAVAIDKKGLIAVANSTGGITAKLPGRIGDTPVIGAGLYANKYGGAAATGHGEGIIRFCMSKVCVDLMRNNQAQRAVDIALQTSQKYKFVCGLIAIDRNGKIGIGIGPKGMSWAYIKDGKLKTFY